MDLQQLRVKVFAEEAPGFDSAALIPIFHRWIQDKQLPHRLLIDVADYRHVHEGPGVILIAHEFHLGLDRGQGRSGLLYARKRDAAGPAAERLEEAFRDALTACQLLEREPELAGKLRFPGNAFRIDVASRQWAPNTDEAWAAFRAELEAFFRRFSSGTPRFARIGSKAPLGAEVDFDAAPPGVTALLAQL